MKNNFRWRRSHPVHRRQQPLRRHQRGPGLLRERLLHRDRYHQGLRRRRQRTLPVLQGRPGPQAEDPFAAEPGRRQQQLAELDHSSLDVKLSTEPDRSGIFFNMSLIIRIKSFKLSSPNATVSFYLNILHWDQAPIHWGIYKLVNTSLFEKSLLVYGVVKNEPLMPVS